MRPGAGEEPAVLSHALDAIRPRVDATLRSFLDRERAAVAGTDPRAAVLVDELRRIVDAGGKRLRPAFCFWGFRAGGGADGDPIVRIAASLELLHTFALIHDDVMDGSATRRGVPTTHERFAAEARSVGPIDAARHGVALAVLAGDLSVVLADQLFTASGFPTDVLLEAKRRYDGMRMEMAVGQLLDLTARGADEGVARRISALKTGSYTVEGPLHVGAILARAPIEVMASLSRYGRPLGEAFQVRDDVLEAVGGGDRDLAGGKPTVLLAWAREAAGAGDRRLLERAGEGLSAEERGRLREVLVATGAIERAAALVDELVDRARAALDPEVMGSEATSALRSLAGALAVGPWT